MGTETEARVLLVDDHEVVREGLRTILQRNPAITVVGEAESVASAVREAERLRPDVILLDLRLPDGSGVDACRQIRSNDDTVKIVILTSYADEDALFSVLLAGASGYLLKSLDHAAIQQAIIDVARGGSLLDPQMATRVIERMRNGSARHPADEAFATLTPQEDRILDMIADGLTNREIGKRLSLTEKTVKNYVSRIYQKLHVERRTQASALVTARQVRKQH